MSYGDHKITLDFYEATDEQLQKALDTSRDLARKCEAQGSWWHTHTRRAEAIENVLAARRRRDR